jgi:hypothetical protein
MMLKQPFEVPFSEVQADPAPYIEAVLGSLASEFWVMPKGNGFVDYPTFDSGYERLKQSTGGFRNIKPEDVLQAVIECPISLVVLRSMLGFTPPEWAYIAGQRKGVEIPQGYARSLDRRIRIQPLKPLEGKSVKSDRLIAMVGTACELLKEGVPVVSPDKVHRLDKCDTQSGASSVQSVADLGVPYPMVLYERFLGRPFAGHRDSVSELVGDPLESSIEDVLSATGISFKKTKRAEIVPGFEQTPDFIVPNQLNPKVIIEAKLSEDEGTARDKITRIENLVTLSLKGQPAGQPKYEVIACIAGRGFVRRSDMKKLILSTRGKVFTPKTLNRLVDNSGLSLFRTK